MSGRSLVLLLLLCLTFGQQPARAKSTADYVRDTEDYVLSPLHWDRNDWEWAAGATAGIATAYAIDSRVRNHFADSSGSQKGDPHNLRDAAPTLVLTLGTLAVGALREDDHTKHVGYDMVEAVALGGASSFVFKNLFAR